MKAYDLLQGALGGACLAGWASVAEAYFLFAAYPYQTDPIAWTSLLPIYLLVGASIGLGCALVLLLVFRRQTEPSQRHTILGLMILTSGATLATLVTARRSWLPTATSTSAPGALLLFAQVLGVGIAAFLILVALSRTFLANPAQKFFSPRTTKIAAIGLVAVALLSLLLPVSAADRSTPANASHASADAPNVLLVVLDTVAAAHLSSYGYERPTSPRLDQLAREGALFEKHYAAAPWTLPSHASIFSGLLPNNHGSGWERPRLSDGLASLPNQARYDFHTIAEEMARLGYDTCGASEKAWLSAETGLVQGFNSYFDFSELDLRERFFLHRIWDRYRAKFGMKKPAKLDKGGASVIDSTLGWLAGGRSRNQEKPFFLFMNLNEAHDPYRPPQEFWASFLADDIAIEDTRPPLLRSDVLLHREVLLGVSEITPRQMEIYKSLYDAEILYQDGLLGRLFDGLDELGIKDDTLIIVTSDHGEEFGEIDGRVGHQLSLSDYLLHVPLIMRYPALIPAGRRVQSLASSIDIFPTVLDVLETQRGFAVTPTREIMALEGVSQLAAMKIDGAAARDLVMAHYSNPTAYLSSFQGWTPEDPYSFVLAKHLRSMDTIRTHDDKLYMYSDGDRAYIDFATDPSEQNSVLKVVPENYQQRADFLEWRFDRQINSFVVARELLTGHLNWFRAMSGKPIGHKIKVEQIDSANMTQQELEAMGYVGTGSVDSTQAKEAIGLPPFEAIKR